MANLKITLPTPKTHPDLASLWAAVYNPKSVYDLFWPPNWHFCRPPGRPIARGRFGVADDRLWRHVFMVPEWSGSDDASVLFCEHLTLLVTRAVHSQQNESSHVEVVTFPRDCIEVLRCRSVNFNHRVVNKWFSGHSILIGDAAHVFLPFGGQGVACGVQDAVGLAWRLAILTRMDSTTSPSPKIREALLQSWVDERRMSIDNSARLTRQNGELCNKEPTFN